jgi:hypothetical protein
MASAFLPLLSYGDDDADAAATEPVLPPVKPQAASAPAAGGDSKAPAANAPRTISVPPAAPGSNITGIDQSVLDGVLRRFSAVDLSAERPAAGGSGSAAGGNGSNPTAAKAAAGAAGVKPALKKKAASAAPAAPPKDAATTAAEAAAAARLAAEAAARRTAAEATQRARQARANAALAAVLWVTENTASSEEELRAHALGPLTAAEFGEAMQERALGGTCGCPLCDNDLTCVRAHAYCACYVCWRCVSASVLARQRADVCTRIVFGCAQQAEGCRAAAHLAGAEEGVPLRGAAILRRGVRHARARAAGAPPFQRWLYCAVCCVCALAHC